MSDKRILIACEYSGVIRDKFIESGYSNCYSCDIIPDEGKYPNNFIQGNVLDILKDNWDMMIAHPPCTHLAVSGARWFKDKVHEQKEAIKFVETLWDAPIKHIAIENPVGILSTRSSLGKATQYIQPWEFGHGETKKTGLWLKNLPKLVPTDIVEGRDNRIHRLPPSEDRGKLRSKTYVGIAEAIVDQWGSYVR